MGGFFKEVEWGEESNGALLPRVGRGSVVITRFAEGPCGSRFLR